jgi:SAM-dependent methyltransferase
MHDERGGSDHRERKADKILAILQDFLGANLERYTCLDVGCSRGIISATLAPHFKLMVGVDVDRPAVRLAAAAKSTARNAAAGPFFAIGSGHSLPFDGGSFDVVVCAQVYEHVTDQPALAREVERVLRPGGICFFSGPNRLAVVEEHYWLPFLSWLPRPLASAYMRLFKRGDFVMPTRCSTDRSAACGVTLRFTITRCACCASRAVSRLASGLKNIPGSKPSLMACCEEHNLFIQTITGSWLNADGRYKTSG